MNSSMFKRPASFNGARLKDANCIISNDPSREKYKVPKNFDALEAIPEKPNISKTPSPLKIVAVSPVSPVTPEPKREKTPSPPKKRPRSPKDNRPPKRSKPNPEVMNAPSKSLDVPTIVNSPNITNSDGLKQTTQALFSPNLELSLNPVNIRLV